MALPAPLPPGYSVPATPAQFSVGGSLLPADVIALGPGAVAAINKALSSGVEEYSIGSRSLKRHQLEQLLNVLRFSQNAGAAVSPDGSVSAIQTRRGVPTDT